MYLSHFQLNDLPFRLTPHLAYRFEDQSQAEARTVVRVALEQGAGFIKVTGEVGLGKTLLCRRLLADLEAPYVSIWLPDPMLAPEDLRMAVARELGLAHSLQRAPGSLHKLLPYRLLELAARGKQPVLLIDEAQALPTETLETVRLLTNLETEQRKLLQVVLFGQPELDRRLASDNLRQLRQRIVHSCRLQPLGRDDVARYIDHRLTVAGGRPGLFSAAAISRIAQASGGTPRLINILADKALLAAYGRGRQRVGWAEARRAVNDTEAAQAPASWPESRRAARPTLLGLLAFGAFLALTTWPGRLA